MRPSDSRNFTTEMTYLSGAAVLKCKGELDFSNETELVEAVETLLNRRLTHVCLDLRELDFTDTTVLRVLEGVERSAQERDVYLEMLTGPAVQRLLDVVGWSPELHGVARNRYAGSRGRAGPAGRRRPGHPRHHRPGPGEFRL